MRKGRRGKATGVYLSNENRKRLEYARTLGLNASQVVDELLLEHLKPYLEQLREKRLHVTLNAPVP
jgi:hypothetical protein